MSEPAPVRIVAALVIYETALAASQTWNSLRSALDSRPRLRQQLTLLVYDNSAKAQKLPPNFVGEYIHDGSNTGLAARYNAALHRAGTLGAPWLLLLDQDTVLTPGYLDELSQAASKLLPDDGVGAVVPLLRMANGQVLSPHVPPYAERSAATQPLHAGPLPPGIWCFNSGAMLRCSALEQIGGFDERFWLDYLDHATFAQLQQAGRHTWLLQATLTHALAQEDRAQQLPRARRHNILAARARFYALYGSSHEQREHRRELRRSLFGRLRRGHLREAWFLFRLWRGRVPHPRPPGAGSR